jgi:hypothetical protein
MAVARVARELDGARRRHLLAPIEDLALADEARGHVGHGRQIARGPDRALRRHHGRDAVVEEVGQAAEQRDAHARVAEPEAQDPAEHGAPHRSHRQRRAGATAMEAQEPLPERERALRRDPRPAVAAEPGRHPVDGRLLGHGLGQPRLTGRHPPQPCGILRQANLAPVHGNLNEGIDGKWARAHHDRPGNIMRYA